MLINANVLDSKKQRLYFVTFDKANNPVEAKLAIPNTGIKHGLSSWNKKSLFTISVYVEAINEKDALQKAKEIANKRIERL